MNGTKRAGGRGGKERRVAMISEHASPAGAFGGTDCGGQNVYVDHVSRRLAARGYQVDIFTRRDRPELPEIVRWREGVRIINVPAGPPEFIRKEDLLPHIPDFASYIRAFVGRRPEAYRVVHANFWMSGLAACELKKAFRLPFVVTFHALGRVRRLHQGAADDFPDVRFQCEDKIIEEADCVIAECPQDREDLLRLYRADEARLTLIPCGYDPAEMAPVDKAAARRFLGLPEERPIALQLGRMVPRKGVDFAIRGFAACLRRTGRPALLLVVGGESEVPDPRLTPEIGRLRRVAREEGVSEHVVFAGRRGREVLRYYYSAADVFLTTPWYEPFGITPVEAMACGTPVIGTEVGGIKFTVKDGETGFLVSPRDVEGLGRRLAALFQDEALRTAMSRAARRRAETLFQWDHVGEQVARLYESVRRAREGRGLEAAAWGRMH